MRKDKYHKSLVSVAREHNTSVEARMALREQDRESELKFWYKGRVPVRFDPTVRKFSAEMAQAMRNARRRQIRRGPLPSAPTPEEEAVLNELSPITDNVVEA
jgi:hypothetical protein